MQKLMDYDRFSSKSVCGSCWVGGGRRGRPSEGHPALLGARYQVQKSRGLGGMGMGNSWERKEGSWGEDGGENGENARVFLGIANGEKVGCVWKAGETHALR